jgi:hypothetical protein
MLMALLNDRFCVISHKKNDSASWHCNCKVFGMGWHIADSLDKDRDMKFVKTLFAVAILGSAFAAQAESTINTGAAANLATSARLNFSVVIPRVIYLRVGNGTDFTPSATIDTISFAPGAAAGTGTPVAGSGSVTVRLFATGTGVTLGATGSGTGLTSGALPVMPWTQISATSVGLAHPTIGSAAAAVPATGSITSQSGTWSFNYANALAAAGTYTGQVTYTATLP